MAVLKEGEFELDGYVFGGSGTGPVYVERYEVGTADWSTTDDIDYYTGRRTFGEDALSGPTWNFELNLIEDNTVEALAALESLARHWRARAVAAKAGETSVLKYRRGGRTRRVYGRARNFSYDPNVLLVRGALRIIADFVTEDAVYYSDVEESSIISTIPARGQGFSVPFRVPIRFTSGGEKTGVIDVEGTVRTPVIVTFNGPVNAPWVETLDWKFKLDVNIAANQSATLDSRTGSVKLSTGASLAGKIGRETYMRDIKFKPGPDYIRFGGVDPSATATCVVKWRPAYEAL